MLDFCSFFLKTKSPSLNGHVYNLLTWYVRKHMEIICFVKENVTKYKSSRASICGTCVAFLQGEFSKGNVLSTYIFKHFWLAQKPSFLPIKEGNRITPFQCVAWK